MDSLQWLGVFLVVLGFVLYFVDIDFDVDIDIPGANAFDFVGIAGGICFIIGALLIVDNIKFEIGVIIVVIMIVAARSVVRYKAMQFPRYPTPGETMIGQVGYTKTKLSPKGLVQLRTELCSAVSDNGQHIEKDTKVMVIEVEGNTVLVFEVKQ